MAYREINPTELAVDKPLTQQLFQALRDNSDAIPASNTGAPKIQEEAISDSGVTAGTNMVFFINTGNTQSDRSGECTITAAGTYRLQAIAYQNGSQGDMTARVYIDGVEDTDLAKALTGGGTGRSSTKDLTLAVGQVVRITADEGGAVFMMAAALTFGISDKSALGRGLLFSVPSTSYDPYRDL